MSLKDEPGERRGLLPRYTLKDHNTFLLADALGDIQGSDDGFFSNDTRMLSRFELAIAGRKPSVLGAAISQDNTLFTAHLTNRPLAALGEAAIPRGVIHLERSRYLWDSRMYERLRLTNFSEQDAQVPLQLSFDADFADIFEIQGHERKQRGCTLPAQVHEREVLLGYEGLDHIKRCTHVQMSWTPSSLSATASDWLVSLQRGHAVDLFIEIGTDHGPPPSADRFDAGLRQLTDRRTHELQLGATLHSSGRLFNEWLERSRADLVLLTTHLPTGPYPYAGIPWFATQFGRDAIVASLQSLWIHPALAAGVLRFLASTQARETSAFRDSEPGKIVHEIRRGEMAALGEVPFGRYYGGVDTTPLFVMLAGEYESCTGDRALINEIWPALLAATAWIEGRLKRSPTGFLDYARGADSGLANQAWKDSQDSIFYSDGRFPTGPIAVVEVQGYAFAALEAMSRLAALREERDQSAAWRAEAATLKAAIEERFWVSSLDFYAIALDGNGEPCSVPASNAGHLLYCGVPGEERARKVTEQLCSERFDSGWGIRTLARGQARFNPMSYHNGSIWPHDTSLCAAGIARYGGRSQVVRILSEVFEAANHFGMRLPELYCGFPRVRGQGPAPYPVACLPQAWASGSAFMLLQACLGLRIDGHNSVIHLERAQLPEGIESLQLQQLPIGKALIDLEFRRLGNEVVIVPTKHLEAGVRVLAHL